MAWTLFLDDIRFPADIKYPRMVYDEVLERDRLEEYKKYLDNTIE